MISFFLQLSFSRRFCALFSHWLNGYTWYPCVVKTSASLSPDRNKHDALPDATGKTNGIIRLPTNLVSKRISVLKS